MARVKSNHRKSNKSNENLGPGRPRLPEDKRLIQQTIGLYKYQWDWLEKEATDEILVPALVRRAVDWYMDAVERQRGDSESFKIFDNIGK